MSHPTWVRGLKPREGPCSLPGAAVAPYVGAWIETYACFLNEAARAVSHPTWVRGLKLKTAHQYGERYTRRTLRGCVD